MKKTYRRKGKSSTKKIMKTTPSKSKAPEDKATPEVIQALLAEAMEVTANGHLGEAKNKMILLLVDCLKWHKRQRDLVDWSAFRPRLEQIAKERSKTYQDLNSIAKTMTANLGRFCSKFGVSITAPKRPEPANWSSGELVPFPLLKTPYLACAIGATFPSVLDWLNIFADSIPSFQKRAESDDSVPDAPSKAEKFAQRFTEILEDLKKDPQSYGILLDCIVLYRLREQVLRELGFNDIFKKIKDEENAKAISLFKDVVRQNDAIEDTGERVENLIRGIFAGNMFDLGSAELAELFSKDGMSFLDSCQNLEPKPFSIYDLEAFISKWNKKKWKKAVIFVDNSGADIILGILPFARELLRCGTQVVLAANELPSINDVTHTELTEIISKLKDENGKLAGVDTSNLYVVNSGNDFPVINLTKTSKELANIASDADLVILEGMGRAIETNLFAQFRCDSLNIGVVTHHAMALFLRGSVYDCVFKYEEVLG